jgi:hypothetical protein
MNRRCRSALLRAIGVSATNAFPGPRWVGPLLTLSLPQRPVT